MDGINYDQTSEIQWFWSSLSIDYAEYIRKRQYHLSTYNSPPKPNSPNSRKVKRVRGRYNSLISEKQGIQIAIVTLIYYIYEYYMMSGESDKICKDDTSKSNNDGICDVIGKLQNMNTDDNKDRDIMSVCANCGKKGDDVNNTCNKCKQVKYCNAVCKKVHKKKHKKDCEEHVRLAAQHAAELHDIELFKQPPPAEDCPICFQRIPLLKTGYKYKTCCGKVICSGCSYAPVYDNQGNEVDNKKCAFCRTPWPSEKETSKRLKKRMEANDPEAIFNLGGYYREGLNGYPQNHTKALELFYRSGELGYAGAYCNIGFSYDIGRGVEVDEKKATYYYELAAMMGDATARYNLGFIEKRAGNMDRALKHMIIAARSGYNRSLEKIKVLYTNGHATKEDYTKALQLYQTYLSEIKSIQRDKAAAAHERYKYY